MKKIFTLIISSLIVVSTIGQTAKRSISDHKLRHGSESFNLKMIGRPGYETNYHVGNNQNSQMQLKSAQVVKQRLDSMVYLSLDTLTNLFVNYNKDEYTYNANGKLIKEINFDWDIATMQWIGNWKSEYSYDSNGNETMDISYNWDEETNKWVESYKSVYTLNNKGEITQELNYDWDEETSQWVVEIKYENSYNTNGSLNQVIVYYWDESTSALLVVSKREYSYNENGDVTKEIISYYNEGSANPWLPNNKFDYSYGVNGNETKIYSLWNPVSNQWDNSSKYETNYNSNGDQTEWIMYDWDMANSQWVGDMKEQFIYDANKNMINYIYFQWNASTNQWVNDKKEEYTYNNSYSFTDLLLPYEGSENTFRHMITGGLSSVWDNTSGQWVISEKYTLYYSQINVSGNVDILANELKVYPNPATGFVMFDLKDASQTAMIELFDIQGRKVISQILPKNKQIQVGQLNSGMHFYKLNQNGVILNGKIMIK